MLDPARWIPEAARLIRPGGRLVFHTTTVLVAMCQPGMTGYAVHGLIGTEMRDQLAEPWVPPFVSGCCRT